MRGWGRIARMRGTRDQRAASAVRDDAIEGRTEATLAAMHALWLRHPEDFPLAAHVQANAEPSATTHAECDECATRAVRDNAKCIFAAIHKPQIREQRLDHFVRD